MATEELIVDNTGIDIESTLISPLAVTCIICIFCEPKSVLILLPLILAVPLMCWFVIELSEIYCDWPASTPWNSCPLAGASVKLIVLPVTEYADVAVCITPSRAIVTLAAAGVTSVVPTVNVKLVSEPSNPDDISSNMMNSPEFVGPLPIYAIIFLYLI